MHKTAQNQNDSYVCARGVLMHFFVTSYPAYGLTFIELKFNKSQIHFFRSVCVGEDVKMRKGKLNT